MHRKIMKSSVAGAFRARMMLLGLIVVSLAAVSSAAQDLGRPRSIVSDGFVKNRPEAPRAETSKPEAGKAPAKGPRKRKRPATYRLGAAERVRRRADVKPAVRIGGKNIQLTEVGVTMWRLRSPRMGEEGARFRVRVDNADEFWVAERVGANTRFKAGDKVRIAIESSVEGYLYVVNSEFFADGSYGRPKPLFPATREDYNFVLPGQLIDIPDKSENLSYFNIEASTDPGYRGEALTVIISPTPIEALRLSIGGEIQNVDALVGLEARADFDFYSRVDLGDKLLSGAEADASCGARTRQLVRDSDRSRPCGSASRQLSRDEAKPQSIYRIRADRGQAGVAFVKFQVVR